MIAMLIRNAVAIIGALWLGIAGFAGGVAWEHRPANWPNVQVLFWHFGFGDGLATQLATANAQVKAYAAAEKAAADHAKVIEALDAQISARLAATDQAAQTRIVTVTKTITKEIPVAIPAAVDRAFPLPVGLLRVHDAAALGIDLSAVPHPSGLADDSAGPISASAFGTAVVSNYGVCHADQQRLRDLQGWVRMEQATWAQPVAAQPVVSAP